MVSERPGHSRGWDGQRHMGQTSSSSQTYANTAGQIRRAWVCGLVGLWGFVLFFLRTFLCVFWLCSEPLVPCTTGPCKDAWGWRLKQG